MCESKFYREFYGETFKASSTPVIRFSIEKPVVDKPMQPTQKTVEDEAYCPPTPVPKKSILKDPNTTDKSGKQVKTKFLFLKNKKPGRLKIVTRRVFGKGVFISD